MIDPERELEIFKSHVAPQKFVERQWLVEHRHGQDDDAIYYLPCPICGQSDHCLTERRPSSPVAHCHVTGKMLLIQEIDIVAVMEKEEREFIEQVKEWKGKLPEKLTVEEAFTLRTQNGVPAELLELRVDDSGAFYRRLEEHRETGKAGKKFRSEIF